MHQYVVSLWFSLNYIILHYHSCGWSRICMHYPHHRRGRGTGNTCGTHVTPCIDLYTLDYEQYVSTHSVRWLDQFQLTCTCSDPSLKDHTNKTVKLCIITCKSMGIWSLFPFYCLCSNTWHSLTDLSTIIVPAKWVWSMFPKTVMPSGGKNCSNDY